MVERVPLDRPAGDIDRMPGLDGMPDDGVSPAGETRESLPRADADPAPFAQQEPPPPIASS